MLSALGCSTGHVGDPKTGLSAGRRGGGSGDGAELGADGGAVVDGGAQSGPYVGSASAARRLSRAELDNTLSDLLGDDTAPASRLLAEDLFAPYDNDYPTQRASGALIDSLETLAANVAPRIAHDKTLRKKLVSCTPSSASDASCFSMVVQDFTRRAFRRPVTKTETDAYMSLLAFATESNDFYTGVELLIRSVLQDPEFLYRIERGTKTSDAQLFDLNDHELAVRLSYLLWGSTPDAALDADADAGHLHDAGMRVAIAKRMLEDPRARTQLHRFHAMWLGYRAIPQTPALAAAFSRETSALIDRVVFDEPQDYLNVFTFDQTYLDDTLADHYGLPRPSGGKGWVSYGKSGRAGILSQGAVLSAFGKFSDTSPTQRGIFVRTRLLCEQLMPPPPNVMADKPPAGSGNAVCKYDRYAEHRSNASCAGCHSLTDGIGFGLENYGLAGVYRTHDDGHPECTIAGKGEILGVGTFSGPAELGKLLVDQNLVQACIVQQFLRFAIGRAPEGNELDALSALSDDFGAAKHELAKLILSYIESDAFARRLEPK